MYKNEITINKKKIAEILKTKLGLSSLVCEELVKLFFEGIYKIVLTEKKLVLQNFGSFSLNRKKARPAQNMRSGKQIMLLERQILRFSPSKFLKSSVNDDNVDENVR